MTDINERELGWDDEIEKESEYVLLPEGDYNFVVDSFTRGRHNGSAKLPACNKAELEITVDDGKGHKGTIFHNLFLHTKTEGMLSAFFISIGQKKHGEPLRMNWNKVIGARGRCKVAINKWTNDKGEERTNNKIQRFYEPDNKSTPNTSTTPKFRPGAF